MVIWKYTFVGLDTLKVQIPKGARIVNVDMQYGAICMWALVDPQKEMEDRKFTIVGTGYHFNNLEYVGSVRTPPYVWHVMEVR